MYLSILFCPLFFSPVCIKKTRVKLKQIACSCFLPFPNKAYVECSCHAPPLPTHKPREKPQLGLTCSFFPG